MIQTFKRGLLTGLIVATWLIAGFSVLKTILPNSPHYILRTITGLLGLIILFTGILSGISKAKAAKKGNPFTYIDALKTGVIISITVAIVVSLASVLYVTIINPGFTDDMVKEAETALSRSHATPAGAAQRLAAVRNEFSVRSQMIIPLIAQSVCGTIFSLILGLFFRTKQKSEL